MNPSIRRGESRIQLSDWGDRFRREWRPVQPRAAMILVHGYAEHTGRYDEMAMFFAREGFAVHAYDQAGHGRTPGIRGHVDRFDRLLDEAARFVDFVSLCEPGLPIVLVGHSMGGLVAAATAAFRGPRVERLVLSGALLELGADTPRWKQWAARLLAPLGGRVGLAAGLDTEGLSRDPEVGRRYTEDPFVKDRMSARFASGMMKQVVATAGAAHRLTQPALILHGEDDPISPASGSRAFFAGLAPDAAAASELKLYPGLRHEIFQEPERETIWREMLEWLGPVVPEKRSEQDDG